MLAPLGASLARPHGTPKAYPDGELELLKSVRRACNAAQCLRPDGPEGERHDVH